MSGSNLVFRRKRTSVADTLAFPLILGGVAVLAADLGRRLYRHTQIFCPSREPLKSWNPTDYGIPEGAVEEHWIDTPDGETLHAWYCRAGKPIASGVFCHGNTGNLTISAEVIPHLLNAGFNVLFFDYRGFGRSSGHASYAGVIADGITAARYHERIRPKQIPSLLYGFSLGGAIAAQVIRRHPFDALILQSTFTSLPQVTRALFPRLPLHLFAGNLFDTLSVIRRLQVPLLVLHGTDDEVCPCWMAHELIDACKTLKRMHCVEGGLHKDLFVRDPDALIWAITQFIAELPHTHRTFSVEEGPPYEQWIDTALRAVRRAMRRKTSVIASAAR
ncbi:MAG TPA: alpha/beta fold hydrolase [Thermoanaerobaculia bacterium]|nr:alpha/beta fold hydrolase [Thermoanaerobaculia bacterium]